MKHSRPHSSLRGPAVVINLSHVLAVIGPALTTFGAGLLAYDVLRGPRRLARRHKHAGRLKAEAQGRDASAREFETTSAGLSTREHEIGVAEIDANFDSVIDRVQLRFERAATREGERAFYIGVSGLVLVGCGGLCQTVAALLVATGYTG
jgi:hypothetical protein